MPKHVAYSYAERYIWISMLKNDNDYESLLGQIYEEKTIRVKLFYIKYYKKYYKCTDSKGLRG